MSITGGTHRCAASSVMTWVVAMAVLALPIVWLDVYLLSPRQETSEYVIGRYSLLLGAAAAVSLVVERARGVMPWTSVIVAVLAWVGVVLGKFVGAGAGMYPWLIAAAAVIALVAVALPGVHRTASLCTAIVLALVTGIGVLGLA